jgi:hypothetical protein
VAPGLIHPRREPELWDQPDTQGPQPGADLPVALVWNWLAWTPSRLTALSAASESGVRGPRFAGICRMSPVEP